MRFHIEMSKVVPVESMRGEDEEETAGLRELFEEASSYLGRMSWHRGLGRAYLGIGVPGVVGVFLFELTPANDRVDDRTWVIVGDVPPAYITTEDAPNPAAALDGYIGAMEDWVEAAKARRSVDGLIPVNVAPTPDNAARLESRLRFLDEKILSDYADDLED